MQLKKSFRGFLASLLLVVAGQLPSFGQSESLVGLMLSSQINGLQLDFHRYAKQNLVPTTGIGIKYMRSWHGGKAQLQSGLGHRSTKVRLSGREHLVYENSQLTTVGVLEEERYTSNSVVIPFSGNLTLLQFHSFFLQVTGGAELEVLYQEKARINSTHSGRITERYNSFEAFPSASIGLSVGKRVQDRFLVFVKPLYLHSFKDRPFIDGRNGFGLQVEVFVTL